MSEQHIAYIHRYDAPKDTQEKRTLLLLHGTGGDENALSNLGRMLLPGAGHLSPRGNVQENGMSRFFRRFAEGVLDIDDLKQRTLDLVTFIQQASEIYSFDVTQIIAVGFSNGANIAASQLLLYPETLRGAILLHPMLPFEPDTLPALQGKPIFIGAGREDPLVPVAQTTQLADLFTRAGAQVSQIWQHGGHSISVEEVKAARNWLVDLR
jgi:predicted esterase